VPLKKIDAQIGTRQLGYSLPNTFPELLV